MAIVQLRQIEIYTKLVSILFQMSPATREIIGSAMYGLQVLGPSKTIL